MRCRTAARQNFSEIAAHCVLLTLSVCPRSFAILAKLSDHQPDGRPAQERQAVAVQTFPVLGQAAAPVEPRDGPLDNPALGQHHECAGVGSLDDLHVDLLTNLVQTLLEFRALIAAVSVKLQQKRKQAEQCAHQEYAAVAILDIGGMDNGGPQHALFIYQDMALRALELFARIIAMRIDRDPPFSALLTLWLSMMAAVGLALRSANWRHST